mmetsp:Transcript_104542/g.265364  ORF Transcript_104542/g.265364 Transcript_104542/m.265364 type:complete len:234 (+) Transcript_104542:370-1071(+)
MPQTFQESFNLDCAFRSTHKPTRQRQFQKRRLQWLYPYLRPEPPLEGPRIDVETGHTCSRERSDQLAALEIEQEQLGLLGDATDHLAQICTLCAEKAQGLALGLSAVIAKENVSCRTTIMLCLAEQRLLAPAGAMATQGVAPKRAPLSASTPVPGVLVSTSGLRHILQQITAPLQELLAYGTPRDPNSALASIESHCAILLVSELQEGIVITQLLDPGGLQAAEEREGFGQIE